VCHTAETRDTILRATPVPIAGTYLVLLPWTRLAHAEADTMKLKVAIELEGIPPHAWAEDTTSKILAPSCWLHAIDQQTVNKTDLSTYKLSAWTTDPRAIPKVVWLLIAENEIVSVCANMPIFGNLPPHLHRKKVLGYRVLVHLKHVMDFEPDGTTPPPSPPDDGGSGHDGKPERHHFSGGVVHRIQGFPCAQGVVDGEPAAGCSWASNNTHH
jgi:hypothetical protein